MKRARGWDEFELVWYAPLFMHVLNNLICGWI